MSGLLILGGTVLAMELVAYLTHRFLMHGPLWFLHESHHVDHEGAVERNDLFGVLFAIPSMALIYFGTRGADPLLWVGLGMTVYGAIYFLFHDVLVHRRIEHSAKPRSRYLRRIVQAHHIHHATKGREGAVSFGFLYAPPVARLKREAAERRGRRSVRV